MVTVKDVKLFSMLGLTLAYFLGQIITSHVTHSLTLLMSSYQMLYNILTLLGCIGSLKMSREKSLRNTFGWARVEVLGMMMSILFLAALSFSVVVEAVQTMVHASHQDAMHHPLAVLAIAGAGLLLNGLCFVLLGGYTQEQSYFLYVQGKDVEVNIVLIQDGAKQKLQDGKVGEASRSSSWGELMLNFCRDISSCVLVVLCSCIVYFYDGDIALFADPILSIVAVFILMTTSYPYVKQSGLILLQTIPENIDVNSLKKRLIQKFPSILNVHDTHVWRLARNKIIATCHVICMSPKEYSRIANLIEEFFHSEGITLVTIQPEFLLQYDSPVDSTECILSCDNIQCQALRCCAESDMGRNVDHDDHDDHTLHHRSNVLTEQSLLQDPGKIKLSEDILQRITTV